MTDTQHFAKLIENIKFTMFTTVHGPKHMLRSRPMTLQETEFDGILWFIASRESEAALDLQLNPKVNLAFANPKDQSYISASGEAEVVVDKDKAKELWNPLYKAWFEKGLDDPKLCLIKVKVIDAHYWESPSSTIVTAYKFAQALILGEKADNALGEQGTIHFA